ncbi:MAG: DUF389 domain-containing protein [Patescibacteria group bacterium]|nr:DUF389 domain-containing protein [Patescibacteria group bacterium]MDE2437979.1 DUF389 domain-containing protein [Patescibacteria group bacterium]
MATLGLLANSATVIVRSMLIAPILYPILSFAMGIVMSDPALISKSFTTLLKAVIVSIGVAAGITLLFSSQFGGTTVESVNRTAPSLLYATIGVVAGFAAAFALVKPQLSETLPGVAISIALVPPLAVVGIGLAELNTTMMFGALLLFLVNTIGIIFASTIIFFSYELLYETRSCTTCDKNGREKGGSRSRPFRQRKIDSHVSKITSHTQKIPVHVATRFFDYSSWFSSQD